MPENETPGYERRDVDPQAIRWAAVGLGLVLIGAFVTVGFFNTAHATRNLGASGPKMEAPAPRLQVTPAAELAKLRGEAEAKLDSYGWVDRDAGLIRIPIQRAMELTAERGLPARTDAKEGAK